MNNSILLNLEFWFQLGMYKIYYYIMLLSKFFNFMVENESRFSVISLRVMIHFINSLICDKNDKYKKCFK